MTYIYTYTYTHLDIYINVICIYIHTRTCIYYVCYLRAANQLSILTIAPRRPPRKTNTPRNSSEFTPSSSEVQVEDSEELRVPKETYTRSSSYMRIVGRSSEELLEEREESSSSEVRNIYTYTLYMNQREPLVP